MNYKMSNECDSYESGISKVLELEYGIKVETLAPLAGAYDRTFDVNCHQYVAKIALDPVSQVKEQILSEVELVVFFKEHGFPVATVVPSKSGENVVFADFFDAEKKAMVERPVWVQTWLNGNMWQNKDTNPAISYKAGVLVGKVDKALEEYKNEYRIANANYAFVMTVNSLWDSYRLRDIFKHDDERKHRLAQETIGLFDEKVAPFIDQLPKQQIHGDCHSRNIMVDDEGKEIVGLIDFTDSRYSCRIYEIAISLPSIIGKEKTADYACVKAFMKGYKSQVQLTQLELDVLRLCVVARVANMMLVSRLFELEIPETYDESYMITMMGPPWDMVDDLLHDEAKIAAFQQAINA